MPTLTQLRVVGENITSRISLARKKKTVEVEVLLGSFQELDFQMRTALAYCRQQIYPYIERVSFSGAYRCRHQKQLRTPRRKTAV